MILPGAFEFANWSLFLLRLMVALVFAASGLNHLRQPRERAKSIGMSVRFTIFLGAAELAGAIGLAVGVLTQWAAIGLILIMLGAIYKKIMKWKIGFWGDNSMGWHYDLMLVVMNLVILCTGGGLFALMPPL
jgi:putative oxidoreductase